MLQILVEVKYIENVHVFEHTCAFMFYLCILGTNASGQKFDLAVDYTVSPKK